MTVAYQPLLIAPAAGLAQVPLSAANALLAGWGHYLGECHRPFGAHAWVLEIAGEPVSVAVSASTVSATVAGLRRTEVVELARLCTAPTARWATRVMLRLWREVAVPAWPYWAVVAAVAYSQNGRHDGSIYRFDGWTKVGDNRGHEAGPHARWSRRRTEENPARGRKTLWTYRYETKETR